MTKKDKRTRSWVFTYHKPDERDHNWFQLLSKKKGIRYMVMGREHTKSDGLHFQGYISFHNGKTFKQTKKWFGLDKIHIKEAICGDFINKKYCSKENMIIEVGVPCKQGKRTDIQKAIDIVKETGSIREVLKQVQNYQAVRHTELYQKYLEDDSPRPELEVINIWGASGRGKTKYVYDNHTDVFKPVNYKWWEGYDGHKVVILDDIRYDFCKFHELLKLLDVHPHRVECKGGSRQLRATKIYITTPTPFVDMWRHRTDEEIYQLERRITHTHNIEELL